MAGSTEIPGAELVDGQHINRRYFTVPHGEFTARLNIGVGVSNRFNVAIGDPAAATEGQAPDVWYGVVESWQPSGSKLLIVARAARNVEESVH